MTSFIPVPDDSPFPVENLPYGIFVPRNAAPRVGVALGNQIVDLGALEQAGLFENELERAEGVFNKPRLNAFIALGRPVWSRVRTRLQTLLSEGGDTVLQENASLLEKALHRQSEVKMMLPVEIGDYTDFYASRQHATNVGTMFRGPDNALMPNWLHLPVGYHGRASSIVVSGTDVIRPKGQTRPDDSQPPVFGPSRLLDFELELGFILGPGNELGTPITMEAAQDHIFGLVLVNDWSARDIQKWEYVPLGPFLGKNFCTSISPWVIPLEAVENCRIAGEGQSEQAGNPEPLEYLRQEEPRSLDLDLEVRLESERMRADQQDPVVICSTNARNLYWSIEQQLVHHTVNGCNVRPGDLMASGTISGEDPSSYGSMLELSWRGTKPIWLPGGEERKFLEDGDRVVMEGWAQVGAKRIGFGTVEGRVTPARN